MCAPLPNEQARTLIYFSSFFFSCSLSALLAMLVEVQLSTTLVSFGALVALWITCNVQLFRRYYPGVQMRFNR
jgi:uncharacterized membrane protein YgaE (UPF0421/DUF939 family)